MLLSLGTSTSLDCHCTISARCCAESPLGIPVEAATSRRDTCDGLPARMINGVPDLTKGEPLNQPNYPHSLEHPVMGTQVKIVDKIDIRLDNVGIWWGIIPCEEPDRAMTQKALKPCSHRPGGPTVQRDTGCVSPKVPFLRRATCTRPCAACGTCEAQA